MDEKRPFRLVQTSAFSMDELTRAYNQARVDYLVPMSMTAGRLAAYVKIYDVDLEHSWAAVAGKEILALAMLGVRPARTWVTRLGVLPALRRTGAGQALVRRLLEETRALGRPESVLEVIKGNGPALALFSKMGYRAIRELFVLGRPPGPPGGEGRGRAAWLAADEALDRLRGLPGRPAWTNEVDSYLNAGDVHGLAIDLGADGRGWMAFRRQARRLSHFVMHTESGCPDQVGRALMAHLYGRFPRLETYTENIPAGEPHLSTLLHLGFSEVFRRVEMAWIKV